MKRSWREHGHNLRVVIRNHCTLVKTDSFSYLFFFFFSPCSCSVPALCRAGLPHKHLCCQPVAAVNTLRVPNWVAKKKKKKAVNKKGQQAKFVAQGRAVKNRSLVCSRLLLWSTQELMPLLSFRRLWGILTRQRSRRRCWSLHWTTYKQTMRYVATVATVETDCGVNTSV